MEEPAVPVGPFTIIGAMEKIDIHVLAVIRRGMRRRPLQHKGVGENAGPMRRGIVEALRPVRTQEVSHRG